ncbi:MAG: hypothetical protein QCH35_01240 [Methanomicrobiaceae archaeon]|nr:hypothetical protein [Methanomicrobiaceae archaeon]
MLSTDEVIRRLWDAQGYGNLAVWGDGTMNVVTPGSEPEEAPDNPHVVFKPLPLVGGYPMLDHAIGDKTLRRHITDAVRGAGIEIE